LVITPEGELAEVQLGRATPFLMIMNDATLNRLLSEAKASGETQWVSTIAGAMDRLPECSRRVARLLEEQDDTHWSRMSGWEADWE
jgi:hypothetical protein